MPIYRFYLDGLIAHIHRARLPIDRLTGLGNLVLGQAPSVLVPTVTFENSLQAREMLHLLARYEHTMRHGLPRETRPPDAPHAEAG